MTRHGRNATNSAVYSYHEKKRDSQSSGYGSKSVRLSKDSVKDFDSCSLSLQRCRQPVCTADGWLYEKEFILQYLLARQKEYDAKVKAYERWLKNEDARREADRLASTESDRKAFEAREMRISSSGGTSLKRKTPSSSDSEPIMPSFWLPSQTPDVQHGTKLTASAGQVASNVVESNRLTSGDNRRLLEEAAKNSHMQKPNKKTIICCPMTKKYLRLKDLISVKFCPIDTDGSSVANEDCNLRYKCPLSSDMIRNTTAIYAIKQTGEIIAESALSKILRPADMQHPSSGIQLKETDLVRLQSGGTGFAATNDQLRSKKYGLSMAVT